MIHWYSQLIIFTEEHANILEISILFHSYKKNWINNKPNQILLPINWKIFLCYYTNFITILCQLVCMII